MSRTQRRRSAGESLPESPARPGMPYRPARPAPARSGLERARRQEDAVPRPLPCSRRPPERRTSEPSATGPRAARFSAPDDRAESAVRERPAGRLEQVFIETTRRRASSALQASATRWTRHRCRRAGCVRCRRRRTPSSTTTSASASLNCRGRRALGLPPPSSRRAGPAPHRRRRAVVPLGPRRRERGARPLRALPAARARHRRRRARPRPGGALRGRARRRESSSRAWPERHRSPSIVDGRRRRLRLRQCGATGDAAALRARALGRPPRARARRRRRRAHRLVARRAARERGQRLRRGVPRAGRSPWRAGTSATATRGRASTCCSTSPPRSASRRGRRSTARARPSA